MTTRIARNGLFTAILLAACGTETAGAGGEFVRVSPRDPRYLELSDGRAYVPNGLNMIAPRGNDFDSMAVWIDKLAANRGNFVRVWLGHPFFDVEHTRSGDYDDERAARIERMLDHARSKGVRVKMCIESFRHFGTRPQTWSTKPLHLISNGGTASTITDFFDGEPSRARFKQKLAWLRKRFGADSAIFAWELWNEINAVAGGDYMAWTESMLPELHRLFPSNLCVQSLGSFDTEGKRKEYRRLATMPGNDVAQVHRYLDLGARLEVCRGPVDVMAADAVRELLAARPGRPVLLAESGAVEPNHSGPFKLYRADTNGVILHDVLFAPFFAGAAGPGHSWHWDAYVAANDLWWHFRRFAEAIEGVDPPAEGFEPKTVEHPRLRVYLLEGRRRSLLWCRDRLATWKTELENRQAPETIRGAALTLERLDLNAAVRAYDPWADRWTAVERADRTITLPAFARSIVVRIDPPRT